MARRRWSQNPTLHEVAEELERELVMRDRVFPRRVEEHRMQQEEMDHKMECLRVALRLVRDAAGPMAVQEDLF